MVTFKSVVNNIICFLGAAILLLCAGEFCCGGHFEAAGGSISLIVLTVIVVIAMLVKASALFTSCGFKKLSYSPSQYVFFSVVMGIIAAVVRCIAFILTDFSIISKEALVLYAVAVANTVLVFFTAGRLWGGGTAVVTALVYALWGAFETLTAMNFSGFELLLFSASWTVLFAAVLLMLYSMSTGKHAASIVLCILSGLCVGIAVSMELFACVFLLCGITYYLMCVPKLRIRKNLPEQSKTVPQWAYTLIFTGSSAVFGAASLIGKYFITKTNLIADLKVLKLFNAKSFFGFFTSLDEALSNGFLTTHLTRSHFANYLHMVMLAVILILAAVGCIAAAVKRDRVVTVFTEFISVLMILAIVFKGQTQSVIMMLPCSLFVAVYGVNSIAEFLAEYKWLYRGGLCNPAFVEECILCEKKNTLDADSDGSGEFIELEAGITEENPKALKDNSPRSDDVATGDTQDDLLNSLAMGAFDKSLKR